MFVNPFNQPSNMPYQMPVKQTPVHTPAVKPPAQDVPRFINFIADYTGCGHWRMLWPEQVLNSYRHCVIQSSTVMVTDPKFYADIKCIKIQRQASPPQKRFIEYLKNSFDVRIVYEIDDICFGEDIPQWNPFREAFTSDETRKCIQEIMELCDEMTVTCESMRQYFLNKTSQKNITVLPNYIPRLWSGNMYDRKQVSRLYDQQRKKPRVLYTGSSSHFDSRNIMNPCDDITHVVENIINTIDKYQWVFYGGIPTALKPYVQSGKIEHHKWTHLAEYPYKLKELKVNAMIAPLYNNIFNRCKSNIKYMEGAATGIPVVCQNICTYNTSCKQVFDTGEQMLEQLEKLFTDKKYFLKVCDSNYSYVDKMWLETECNRMKHFEIYNFKYGSSSRYNINNVNGNKKDSKKA